MASWNTFSTYAKEGEKRIFEEIEKRRANVKQKSLSFLRETVHGYCLEARETCVVYLREKHCAFCVREGIEQPSQYETLEGRNKEDSFLEGQIQNYFRALREHEAKVSRETNIHSNYVHTHEQHQERLPREDFAESKNRDRNYSRSNERSRRAPCPFVLKDESFQYEEYEHRRSDRAYPSTYEGGKDANPYDQRSPRRSNAAVRGYPPKEADQDDYWKTSQGDVQTLNNLYMSLQRQMLQTFQHTAEKRENLSERLIRLESNQHRLNDRLDSQDKLTQKASGEVDRLKRIVAVLQKDAQQSKNEIEMLRSMVGRLLKKDQRLTDQKEAKE
jgi:hypothetical protein